MKSILILFASFLLGLTASGQVVQYENISFVDSKIGIMYPPSSFLQPITDAFNNVTFPFKGVDGLYANKGYTVQFEHIRSFAKISLSSRTDIHFGMVYGGDFNFIPVGSSGGDNLSIETFSFFNLGVKLGPMLYITPVKNLGVGIYGAVNPCILSPGGVSGSYSTNGNFYNAGEVVGTYTNTTNYNVKNSITFPGSINECAGVNIYYSFVIFTVEYTWLHTKYDGSATANTTLTESYPMAILPIYAYSSSGYTFSDILHINILKLTLGIRLKYCDTPLAPTQE